MNEPDQGAGANKAKAPRLPRCDGILRLGLLSLVLCAVLATACNSSDVSSPAVRPVADILAGQIEIADLTASSATVRVETNIDVVCSVVYGPDQSYGSQSTGPDMGGLPHRDHRAPLRGLQPDAVYHYRLQGTGPDGTLYVSDDLAFRTLATEAQTEEHGRNVASLAAGARLVEVSSTFGNSGTWAASNALDGDPRTEGHPPATVTLPQSQSL